MSDIPLRPPEWAPFRVAPHYDPRPWGYCDLRPWFDRLAAGDPIGEVWLTGDMCAVATGPHAGTKLGDLFHRFPEPLLGTGAPSPDSPLLIKVLFAAQKLSVQVHPDDAMAQRYGDPRGKTECWYALAAEPGASLALGLKPGTTLEDLRAGIHDGSLESKLNVIPVAAGDMIFVDAGTVHTIWPGSILLETQQNCDLTYRIYDYGRPRELHIDRAMEATKLKTRAGKVAPETFSDRSVLIDVEYFRLERIPAGKWLESERLRDSQSGRSQPQGLAYLFAAAGSGRIVGQDLEPIGLPPRSITCIPAAAPPFRVENVDGLDLIRISPKWPAGISG
ncbi:MAG TPA: type I phosphomannose isomerase catalytic subunit [Terracidiphilus sp.]|nr:type I phosphomannose isomerase catalytic subunit [Terracidiphilus sp.]